MDGFVRDGVGVDFAEFTLGFVESGVECRNSIGWTVEMCECLNHFQ